MNAQEFMDQIWKERNEGRIQTEEELVSYILHTASSAVRTYTTRTKGDLNGKRILAVEDLERLGNDVLFTKQSNADTIS